MEWRKYFVVQFSICCKHIPIDMTTRLKLRTNNGMPDHNFIQSALWGQRRAKQGRGDKDNWSLIHFLLHGGLV